MTRLVQIDKKLKYFSAAVFSGHKAQGYDASFGWCMHSMANYAPNRKYGRSRLCQELSAVSVMSNFQLLNTIEVSGLSVLSDFLDIVCSPYMTP